MNGIVEIIIEGHLDMSWEQKLDNSRILHDGPNTKVLVNLKDKSHLHGILALLRDLNLNLLSVNSVSKKVK